MPRESLDAPQDLSEEGTCQGAFGELEDEVPGNSDHDLGGVLAVGNQLPMPLSESNVCLPTDGLDLGRQLFRSELQMPAGLVEYR